MCFIIMSGNFKESKIHVIIEEGDQVIFAGTIGKGKQWTKLECAFIVQAMATVMEGTTDELIINMGIARLVGVRKQVLSAAEKVGLTRRTLTNMLNKDSSPGYRSRRKSDDKE